jgi:DNA-binding beta-propeller fold protein YncE
VTRQTHFAAVLCTLSILSASDMAQAAQPYALVTGRRAPRIYAISITAAQQTPNNNTRNAIVARTLVNPARQDGKLLGDPANIIVSEDQKIAYVMNHHGAVVNAEFLQHGGRGNISVNASPDGSYVAVTGRESHMTDFEGNTLSIIDVDRARRGLSGAEAARVRVGTDNPDASVRPFWAAWTPDGQRVVVTNYRVNSLSVVDLKLALAQDPKAEIARIPLSRPDGQPARPKGVAVTPDGRHAIVSGGPNTIAASTTELTGMIHIIDLRTLTQVATVTGVGIDPYGVVIVDSVDGE